MSSSKLHHLGGICLVAIFAALLIACESSTTGEAATAVVPNPLADVTLSGDVTLATDVPSAPDTNQTSDTSPLQDASSLTDTAPGPDVTPDPDVNPDPDMNTIRIL